MTNSPIVEETTADEIKRIFNLQKENQYAIANSTISQRRAKLKKLHRTILAYRPLIKDALYNDFRKHPTEVDITELFPVTGEIKYARRHLRHWVSRHRVDTPIAFLGSSSHIIYEPKGVVLIISPWNFPLNLTFGPLVSAIAAGNAVMLKPSEQSGHMSALMKKIVEEVFDEREVALVEGGEDTAQSLLTLPFNHIFFTGSSDVGKIVMKAASKHLTSVTLELGGKTPTIVDETANIETAAKRIAWGKFVNKGQICIAPDHVFVHESVEDAFIKALNKYIKKFYSDDASQETSYARLINNWHFHRVKNMVDETLSKGAKVVTGGHFNESENYIAPTILSDIPSDSIVKSEEIFGPVLPVYTFTDIGQLTQEINTKEKPLALYIYSNSKKNVNYLLANTRAGGTCINHNGVQYFNQNLPFGGSNNSGMGKGHGWYGFQAFSNARGVYKQHIPGALELLTPPYNKFKQKLIDFTIKYL